MSFAPSLRGLPISAALAAALAAPAAHAALINFDFNFTGSPQTYSGAAVVGTAGDFWNAASGQWDVRKSASGIALTDAAHAGTGLTLSFDSGGDRASGAYRAPAGACLFSAADPLAALMCDYVYDRGLAVDAVVGSLTLAGLAPGSAYTLYLYSSANAPGRQTDFMLGGVTQSTKAAATGNALVGGVNYTAFSGVAGAGGELALTYTGPREGNLNGFQLLYEPANANGVPEPNVLALAGLGLVWIGWLGRRRSGAATDAA